MSEADLAAAVAWSLTGTRVDAMAGDVHAALADSGWDRAAILSHAQAVSAAGGIWPHPVPDDLRLRLGSAQLLAAVQRAQLDLGLFGQPASPAPPRALNPDERRLLQEVPPHHGG